MIDKNKLVGKETHAVEPYNGIDPLLLASEVIKGELGQYEEAAE